MDNSEIIKVLNNGVWCPIWNATRQSIDMELFNTIRYNAYTIPSLSCSVKFSVLNGLDEVTTDDKRV